MAVRSVLIADSNARLARVLAELLADEPEVAVLDVCATSERALQLAAEGHPDVVLVSETLDGRPGADVCAALRRAAPGASLLLWSHDPSQQRRARPAADAVLERGMTFRELLAEVRGPGATAAGPPLRVRPAPAVRRPVAPDGADDGSLLLHCDGCGGDSPIATGDMPAAVARARDFFVAHGDCVRTLDVTAPLVRARP